MLAAGWVGVGAGLLPAGGGRAERWMLAAYTAVACLLYGTVMNLWFWPFGAGGATSISYVPGGGLMTNLRHFVAFDLATSLGFDVPRSVLNAALGRAPRSGRLSRPAQRWLNPPDSTLVMCTLCGCTPRWSMAVERSSSNAPARSLVRSRRTRIRWTVTSLSDPVRG